MKKILIIIMVILPFISGCEKFLDRPPLDQISNDQYWKTTVDLKNYTAQFYQELPTIAYSGYATYYESDDQQTYGSADDLLHGLNVISTGSWRNDFAPVRSINIFFDEYSRCEDDFEVYKHYLGEAQFFKAWIYYALVIKYGDVPWYTHALTTEDEEELQKPRDPRTLVVDSILTLLDKSFLNVAKRDDAPWGNNSINKEAVLAFKTRVALNEGTWQKYHSGTDFATSGANPNKYFQACISAAEELMSEGYNAGIYSTGNPETDYFSIFGTGDMGPINEVLLYRAYSIPDRLGHQSNYYTTAQPNELSASWTYVTSHLGNDGKPFDYLALAETTKGNDFLTAIGANCDARLKQNIWMPGDIMNNELNMVFDFPPINEDKVHICPTGFQVKKRTNLDTDAGYSGANDQGHILFSYSEVLLNYAEAKYELDETVAYTQLNQLRARVGMPDFTVNQQSDDVTPLDYGYPISDELYEIRRERSVELVFMRLREPDWKRWAACDLFKGKRPLGYPFKADEFPDFTPLLNEDGLIDFLQNEIPNGYGFRPGQDYLNSIPETEITLNPSLDQNPGW